MGAMDRRDFLRAGGLALGAGFAGAALPLAERDIVAAGHISGSRQAGLHTQN